MTFTSAVMELVAANYALSRAQAPATFAAYTFPTLEGKAVSSKYAKKWNLL
jgi:hypothetical protein